MPRPKRSKKEKIETVDDLPTATITTKSARTKKSDDDFLPTCSTSDVQLISPRVVVNPAVLRYLERSRLTSLDDNPTAEINSHDWDELIIEDELFWDFASYSDEFLATARLARWILDHHGHLSRAAIVGDRHSFR